MKKLTFKFITISLLALPILGLSQSLTWTGVSGADFYDEQNWRINGTENSPADGSLVRGQPIVFELLMNDAEVDLGDDLLQFSSASNGLILSSSTVTLGSISTGKVTVSDTSTLIFNTSAPLVADAKIDLKDNYSWVKLLKVDPFVADTVYMQHISTGTDPLVHNTNALINQYYFQGSLIRLFDRNFQAVTLFDGAGLSGISKGLTPIMIYRRSELDDFDNVTSSFRLERGYQVVMSVFQNGKGLSQAFIASEEALELDLPLSLNNSISFIRVMPWNWVTKKGASSSKGFAGDLGNTWVYNWGLGSESTLNKEYAPMSWGAANAGTASKLIDKVNVTHALGFNESDNCNGQSGQYEGLCQIDIAVPSFSFLQTTGLRLVSPAPREEGPFGWLKNFRDAAQEANVRYDVLGVHWYDWGGNPKNTPFEDPVKVFNRFKNYLDRVYKEHGLPIWITEFNANPNRDSSVHIGFLKLALPYLESLDYVERYDFFSPMPSVAGNREDIVFGEMFNEDGSLSLVGQVYRDHVSTPSIPEATWSERTFLTGLDSKVGINLVLTKDTLNEGEQMIVQAITNRTLGSPQNFSFSIQGISSDQYTFRDIELTIPEGGYKAETILVLNDDDEIEDTVKVDVTIVPISDGIEFISPAVELVITSDDLPPVLSFNEGLENEIKVWPNPVLSAFHVEHPNIDWISVQLISSDGRHIRLQNSEGLYDVSKLSSGVYNLEIELADNQFHRSKIIIK